MIVFASNITSTRYQSCHTFFSVGRHRAFTMSSSIHVHGDIDGDP